MALAARRMDRLEQVASECKERGAADTLCVRTDALNLEDCKLPLFVFRFSFLPVLHFLSSSSNAHSTHVPTTTTSPTCITVQDPSPELLSFSDGSTLFLSHPCISPSCYCPCFSVMTLRAFPFLTVCLLVFELCFYPTNCCCT